MRYATAFTLTQRSLHDQHRWRWAGLFSCQQQRVTLPYYPMGVTPQQAQTARMAGQMQVVAWLGRHEHMGRMLLIMLGAFGCAMTAFALSPDVRLSTSILFFTGALLVMCFSLTTSLVQLIAPPELRGRVVSIYMVAFRGGSPLGGLASGWLITQVGSAPTMLAINGVTLALVAGFFLFRGQGIRDV